MSLAAAIALCTSLLLSEPVSPSSIVYSSTTGAAKPTLDPRCTAELCPIYREAAIRFQAKADAAVARQKVSEIICPESRLAPPTSSRSSGDLSFFEAALLAIASAGLAATAALLLSQ